tara:strand:+ start:263 stop:1606 length:1344 start_codon:yes stop_codon:yes gene_type:complete
MMQLFPWLLMASLFVRAREPVPQPQDLHEFWSAGTVAERDAVAREWVAAGLRFDTLVESLPDARRYTEDAPKGRILEVRTGEDGTTYPYLILVPPDYDASRAYPVRLELHGGMGAKRWDPDAGKWADGWRPGQGQIMILPAGWRDAMWWHPGQAHNLEAILRRVRSTWNVDENRVVLGGNSDGAAALFFMAMRSPDSFAGYVGHVGPPDRLVRKSMGADGQLHVGNLWGQSFHLGYGEVDPLVPLFAIRRYMELFEREGARLDWYVCEGKGHQLDLTDEQVQVFWDFYMAARRDPHPQEVRWSTERVDRYQRRAWVIVDTLADDALIDPGKERKGLLPRLGTKLQLRGPTVPVHGYGRVRADRQDNTIRVSSDGIATLRLLLSPAVFDFAKPIVVQLDGHDPVALTCVPSAATLLHWAARDDDRTRLYGVELLVDGVTGEVTVVDHG